MKVLIGMTRSDTTLSGSFTHIRQIGEAFRALGADVVYVLGGDGTANDKLRAAGFRVHALPALKRELRPLLDAWVLLQLLWIIVRERPDVCSWHTAKIGALGRIAALLTARRSYYVAHGVPFVNTPMNSGYRLYERLERLLSRLPSTIVCVCRFDHDEYLRIGVRPERLLTIPNGMRAGAAVAGSTSAAGERPVLFVTAARFETQKDYATLAEACRLLHADGLHFELRIYGNGPQEADVRRAFADAGVPAVRFCGVVDDFAAELARHDVFLLCSHWEGLPRSIIEAMACARPVVATDVGGVSELVETGVTGVCVPPRDAGAVAAAMAQYIRDRTLLGRHGDAGLRKYRADYTLDVMLRRYSALYLRREQPA